MERELRVLSSLDTRLEKPTEAWARIHGIH
jgi:hypothetical protein